MAEFVPNYNKFPVVHIKDKNVLCKQGWNDVCAVINDRIQSISSTKKIIAIECYTEIADEEVLTNLQSCIKGEFIFTKDYMLHEDVISKMVYPDVTDDAVFGYITRLTLKDFFDSNKIEKFQEEISSKKGIIIIYGVGATLLAAQYDLLVYFDMTRWEGQLRQRRNEVSNLGVNNKELKASLQYKQAYFVDWRVVDKHKRGLMHKWDFVVDTVKKNNPKIIDGKTFNEALKQTSHQPFRVVPFFDPGPWGGQWMKKYCDLDKNEKNFAWCFDGVPEENSLLLQFGNIVFETPSINVVFAQPKELLGEVVEARFGAEFPIRFDFLDTIEGGNLSLQVHPTNEYIREKFGMFYTQDESYYMLDADEGAYVYLGLKDDAEPTEMIAELNEAQQGKQPFDADKFVNKIPVKKHDHVLIPAGTIHCSGRGSMVLEISATPYIFTFKLWDWGRLGLDGKPRPINIKHGEKVIDWTRTTEWTHQHLFNTIKEIASGDGWREEYTGLHETEFIETRRHWFTKTVPHQTNGSVNVLNLIEGCEAIVESPTNLFEPFIVHYAETFIIPESVKEYTIRPHGEGEGKECATLKAFVRFKA
ncbi:MAG: class I mannose-6-phosphate isomerase [Parafilimonas sp.]